ncbi:NAD-dependent epimerase/dehydratase family protein [Mesoaciditoga lauensis]|uniref:NAD-dependent epimerase/dehydratase family protein n=1 Tax=Mesoaciditoga lauensis TaxID=1495039 RepID=UPI00056C67E9|nr:NAD-dependent epimerase/dehydratase family protein [Mesoaciditoga lauensis]
MRILVTGGAGFIGSSLCDKLIERGDYVINLDNLNNYYDPKIKWQNIQEVINSPNYKLYVGDVRDRKILSQIFEVEKPGVVVHLAAMAGVRNSLKDPLDYVDVDVKGTVNLLEFSRKYGIEKFVFGSSSSVYGKNTKVPFKEDDPLEGQVSPYAASKRAGEIYCQTYSEMYNMKISCLRFFTVYGPRQRPEEAIHLFTKLISEGKPIPVFGDGTSKRDYTYVDDVVEGIIKAIDTDYEFEIFNIGNSGTITLENLIKLLESTIGKKAIIDRKPFQLGDVQITYADISKARKILRYEPKTKIEEGVKKFWEWYKKFFL